MQIDPSAPARNSQRSLYQRKVLRGDDGPRAETIPCKQQCRSVNAVRALRFAFRVLLPVVRALRGLMLIPKRCFSSRWTKLVASSLIKLPRAPLGRR